MKFLVLLVCVTSSFAFAQGPAPYPSVTAAQEASNLRTVVAMYRALTRGDLLTYRSFLPAPLAARDTYAQQLLLVKAPRARVNVRTITANGDRVTVTFTRRGAGSLIQRVREYELQQGRIVAVRDR